MTDWKKYFNSTILSRGRQYYHEGRVKRLTHRDHEWFAAVKGSRSYNVIARMGEDGDIEDMECSCLYAYNGQNCKHMAALLYAVEADQKENGVQTELELAQQRMDKEDKVIFKKLAAQTEYNYFDLNMAAQKLELSRSIWEKAKRLAEQKQIVLDDIQTGYLGWYGDSKLILHAEGRYLTKGNDGYAVQVLCSKDRVEQALCYVRGCRGSYTAPGEGYRAYSYGNVCVHEAALMYLMEDYLIAHRPGDATDLRGKQILGVYQQRYVKNSSNTSVSDKQTLYLEPRFECLSGGLAVSFKVGTGKMYVIKDLTEFVGQMERGDTVAFGKTTRINFAGCRLEETSEKYYAFIKRQIKEQQQRMRRNRTRSYYSMEEEIKGNIDLSGTDLDQIYSLIRDRKPECSKWTSQGRKKVYLECADGVPKMTMTVSRLADAGNQFDGIHVLCKINEVMEGTEAVYFLEDHREKIVLCRTEREAIEGLLPLYNMSNDSGEIQFNIGRKHLADFYYRFLPEFKKYGSVKGAESRDILQYLPPEAKFAFYLDADEENLTCEIKAVYGENTVDMTYCGGSAEDFRDLFKEHEIMDQVMQYFPEVDESGSVFHCGREEALIYQVLDQGIEALMTLGEVNSTDRFKRLSIRRMPKVSVGVSMESGLMDLSITLDDMTNEELLEVLKSYRRKKKYFRLKNGDFVNIEEDSVEILGQMMDALHLSPKEFVQGKMQLPVYRALYLDKMLEQSSGIYLKRDSHFRKLVKDFKTVTDSDYEVPETLQDTMRQYQTEGYKWLRTVESGGFGGILADDMGLGKTLQMIAVFLAWKREGQKGTSLVVCPASLVYNWKEELARFAPALNAETLTGTQKERKEKISRYQEWDVLITSYDLLKRDIHEYEGCQFRGQVLDEAQYIKNHTTAAAKAVKLIHSQVRYALTGTPIENRLSELWSIFDYLMPGFLYTYEDFKKNVEMPIVKNQDKYVSDNLRRMTAPFIMRRLKKDVLKDLPDKLEKVCYAAFDTKQQKLYDGQVVHMQAMLEEQADAEFVQNKLKILAELTRLRQVCCDPSLLYEAYDGGSAKREACMELISQAIEGGHRMLIFSQFTSMLELLEQDLKAAHIEWYKITGETAKEKRIELVRDFNEGTVPVFLISLKAGGTGLNLTGADVVIHYDPWWNLAVQNQATDRAHRIGQKNIVTVYKLIAKNSIEEKILEMQEVKKHLADEILSGEMGGLSALTKDELMALLKI